MKISIILAHPHRGSLNHAIARRAAETLSANGHTTTMHDLYAEGFDAILPYAEFSREARLPREIERYCSEVAEADGIVIVHPNWWGQPPAILTGWIDRVLRPGVAYAFLEGDSGEGVPRGLLQAQSAVVLNTSNTESQREIGVFGDPLETIWRHCVFGLCGIRRVVRRTFSVVVTSSESQRRQWLEETAGIIDREFPREMAH